MIHRKCLALGRYSMYVLEASLALLNSCSPIYKHRVDDTYLQGLLKITIFYLFHILFDV